MLECCSPVIEESYLDEVLEPKLALERAYLNRANLFSDFKYIFLTLLAIIGMIFKIKVNMPEIDMRNSKNFYRKDNI